MTKVSAGRGLRRKSWFQKWRENVAWARATGKPVRRALLAASIVELFRGKVNSRRLIPAFPME